MRQRWWGATGRKVDEIVVEGDPLADVRALERVRWVMKGGVAYAPSK